ncbi:PAS/PAC sensor signal transduction histidine kinase [Hymenobacter roseosalivarius DSM 11622]|uniref:histidine kinase n=1 Tax=Hymenobacter roseosalivarius DSM 11622 TaxID=645990 RepID=A0A1W1W1J6_9BACT|nr:ATP-binding protein [Hymenobacter roseosalivarius]SMB99251.1 PAS/PAC sensor signal transduction histidine kinase [Hymenobacter roseosalivarius DSM 11622]
MAESPPLTSTDLIRENEELRYQLQEAEDLISAIRSGSVDALEVQGTDGPRIFTLQGADQVYRTLIEQMSEGALLLSQDGIILYGNASLATLLEGALEALIGGSFADFIPSDFKEYWGALLVNGWAGKSKGEVLLRTRAGTLLPFSLSMNVLEFNDAPALAVIITSLSAQREIKAIQARVAEQNAVIDRKNEELKRQEAARLLIEQAAAEANRILEGIPQIAWTANARGENTYLNRRWFDYIGRPSSPGSDDEFQARMHPDDAGPARTRWQQSLRTGETFEMEYRFRDRTDTYRWMLGRALPSYNEQGAIMQWIGTYTDIHEHRLALERIDQAQRQLHENNEQLTRANVDLDNFIYTASHDLKSPISNIEGLLQALLSEMPPSLQGQQEDQVQPIMAMMQDSVERFKRTIEHLTEVTKLQKEQIQPLAVVKLGPVIEDVRLDLAPLLRESGGILEVDVVACPAVSFAQKNLRSVIYNLLSNAFKYRSPERAPHVWLRCYEENDYAVLTVQDNGLGLDLIINEKRLFGMFQRLHDHVDGSGIGLYMVKKMVENVGGKIEVESEIGVGSVFTVYFKR